MVAFIVSFGFALFFVIGVFLGNIATNEKYQIEAIERGYAIHCPLDGKWAWAGECNK